MVLPFLREVEPPSQRDGRLQWVPPRYSVGQPPDALRPSQEQPVLRSGPPSGGEHRGRAEGSSLSPVWSYIITNGICGPLHSVALLSPGPALLPQSAVCYFLIKPNDFSLFSFLSFWCVGSETTWRGPRGGHSRTLV